MKSFNPSELTAHQRHQFILGTVNPRPICFASTIDSKGNPNLAPYSFFNVVSSNPPIFVISVSNKRDGSEKHTLTNARETGEVVVNLVNFSIARQMAICGVEYEKGMSEYVKGGFTPIPSEMVKPFRVKESPVQFECKVLEIKVLAQGPGASNLIFAEALKIHISQDVFGENETINPFLLDMVGRLGETNYTRVNNDSIFSIRQPANEIAVGFDALPEAIKRSDILTGNDLAVLAGKVDLPGKDQVIGFVQSDEFKQITVGNDNDVVVSSVKFHQYLKELILDDEVDKAWMAILALIY